MMATPLSSIEYWKKITNVKHSSTELKLISWNQQVLSDSLIETLTNPAFKGLIAASNICMYMYNVISNTLYICSGLQIYPLMQTFPQKWLTHAAVRQSVFPSSEAGLSGVAYRTLLTTVIRFVSNSNTFGWWPPTRILLFGVRLQHCMLWNSSALKSRIHLWTPAKHVTSLNSCHPIRTCFCCKHDLTYIIPQEGGPRPTS